MLVKFTYNGKSVQVDMSRSFKEDMPLIREEFKRVGVTLCAYPKLFDAKGWSIGSKSKPRGRSYEIRAAQPRN